MRYKVRCTCTAWMEQTVIVESSTGDPEVIRQLAVDATDNGEWEYGGTEDGTIEMWEVELVNDEEAN